MTIPKGKEFTFTVTVMESNSYLPQNLTTIDLANSTFTLTRLSDLCKVTTGISTLAVTDAVNGKLLVTLNSAMTSSLDYSRGDAVDNYYRKPTYQGVIDIQFTDTTPSRVAVIDKIIVASIGEVCV